MHAKENVRRPHALAGARRRHVVTIASAVRLNAQIKRYSVPSALPCLAFKIIQRVAIVTVTQTSRVFGCCDTIDSGQQH